MNMQEFHEHVRKRGAVEALKLSWMGQPLIELKGRPIKLETRKAAAMLAYLSLEPRKHSRELLATMFWPEGTQQKALANLRRTLSSLNSSVPGWIEADRETISLKRNLKLWVDVAAFDQLLSQLKAHTHLENELCEDCLSWLEQAVQLYRGGFLDGLNLTDSLSFDEWQFFQRDSLHQKFADALQHLSSRYARLADWDQALVYARRWVALDRLHEPACRNLIDLYARSGQRTAALRQYEELSRLLDEQLGQKPEEETRRLYDEILGNTTNQVIAFTEQRSAFPLLKTKLYVPAAPTSRVVRTHLTNQLDEIERKALAIISAPAGFGKTTLLAEWIAQTPLAVAWFSLDNGDNDPYRFLSYLIEALESIHENIGLEARQIMQSAQLVPTHIILASLINDLSRAAEPYVFVLDDYQFITEHAVHDTMAYLLDHLPSNLHLIIATRADPPLQLGRLRAHGQLLELRTQDLRFTPKETAEFLNEVMRLGLSPEDIEALEARTEGWVVGLQMAALSLRGHENASEFIRAFSGSHRFVLDYLVEEVLKRQSEHIQTFLLRTSILEKLNGSLCDALITEESKKAGQTGQEILEYLEWSNLFVVVLDDHKQWYRYHHLFADLLRARLDQLYPGLSGQLHGNAATWFEHQGMTVEAVNHALEAGEYDRAARLVEQNTTRLLAQGELNALMGWIETLPAEVRLKRPWLCVHQAYVLMFAGRTTEVELLLAQAEAALGIVFGSSTTSMNNETAETDVLSIGTAETRALGGAIAAVRAFAAAILMQDAKALSQAQRARKLLPAEDLFNQSLVSWALGYTLHSRGQLAEARAAFEEQIRFGRAMENNATLMIGLTALARVLGDQGKLQQARTLMEDTLAEARRKGIRNLGFIARMEAHLAGVLYEHNELEVAHHLLSEALTRAPFWLNPNHRAFIYSYLARVLLAEGDVQGARMALDEADRIRTDDQLSHWLQNSLEVEIVQIWLALQAAGIAFAPSDPLVEESNLILARWKHKLSVPGEIQKPIADQHDEMILLTLARLSLASCQVEEGLALLGAITHSATAAGHVSAAIEALVLTATALQSKSASHIIPALTALQEALALAEPGGYVRIFLNEGKQMRMLVAEWIAHAEAGPLQNYALHLLSQFDAEPHSGHLGFTQELSRDNP